MTRVVLGTRGSALALAQAQLTEEALRRAFPSIETERRIFVTRGDQKLDLSLLRAGDAGGKGLFTRELEDALLEGAIDVAVHSLKDLPGHNPPGLAITAVLERAPAADVLITKASGGFDALPKGACIGTSSIRRARQIQWLRPDLAVAEWRGNVPTRLRKLADREDIAGIILAEAGLERLGYIACGGELAFEGHRLFCESLGARLIPAIGQGAIALQSRSNRAEITALLRAINHEPTFTCIRAERALQRHLDGDCAMPVGIRATLSGDRLHLAAILFPANSPQPATAEHEGDASNPEQLGAELFEKLAAACGAVRAS